MKNSWTKYLKKGWEKYRKIFFKNVNFLIPYPKSLFLVVRFVRVMVVFGYGYAAHVFWRDVCRGATKTRLA